jgi:adenine-specific DNA-methyltransferase
MTSDRPEFGQPLPKAPGKGKPKAAAARPADEDRVDDYRHEGASRLNLPEAGIATQDRSIAEPQRYEYDPHLDPQLVWAGKAEHTSFEVDTVSLHIHERVSTEAMLRAVRREDVQRTLFGDPQLSPGQELDFYQHQTDWANRLILGDSLLVMNSLIRREGMAGKVQCIYVDPPYGVNYNSNFQPRTDQRDVRDGDDRSLTREPEQIRAYRDTWQLGIHSYLTYLRDRLLLAKDLLADSGSIFVQISDENVHHVREVLDDVIGSSNFVSQIFFGKTSGFSNRLLANVGDHLLWYGKDRSQTKFRPLFHAKAPTDAAAGMFSMVEFVDGARRRLTLDEKADLASLPAGARVYRVSDLTSQGRSSGPANFEFAGHSYDPGRNLHWKTTLEGLRRLADANRVVQSGRTLGYVRYFDDFPVNPIANAWLDTGTGGFTDPKVYVVQTNTKVVARCVLMTTDPGDLVLDPTCGSGTTAYVAEQWGRRWITADTSRVALALARQRLMTASYDWYDLADPERGVDGGFVYRTVPHVTLRSIAQNEPPETETLYDQPKVDKRKTRVAGPFTVEQIPSFGIEAADGDGIGAYDPGALDARDRSDDVRHRSNENPVSSIGELVDLLRIDGVRLPGGRHLEFTTLSPTTDGGQVHAEGEYPEAGEARRIAVSFGPLHGPISARQVEEVLSDVTFAGYHAVLFAGFAFDAGAQEYLSKYRTPKHIQVLSANIAADVLVPDLLKNRRGQQLFAVFGEPDARLHRSGADFTVELLGMDVYDPTSGEVSSAGTDGVAAWFLDTDYDRRSFLVSQGLLPRLRRWRRSLGAPRSRPPRLGRSRCLRDAPRNDLAAVLGWRAGPRRHQGHRLPRQRGHQDPRPAHRLGSVLAK